VKKLNGNIVRW